MGFEAYDGHVEGVIDRCEFFCFGLPQLECCEGLIRGAGADHFDQRGRAARERGLARRLVIVRGIRAHEGQVDVDVRVDEAGKDVFAASFDDLRAGRQDPRIDLRLDPRDVLVFGVNVAGEILGGRDDPPAANQERHRGIQRRRELV